MTKILEAAGSGLQNVVKVNVYLTNLTRDFSEMNSVYISVCFYFSTDVSITPNLPRHVVLRPKRDACEDLRWCSFSSVGRKR
jgi:enamine deaminase RidA (YjgF/YER057c/UK114 family)